MTDKQIIYIGEAEESEFSLVRLGVEIIVSCLIWFGLLECLWMLVKGLSR